MEARLRRAKEPIAISWRLTHPKNSVLAQWINLFLAHSLLSHSIMMIFEGLEQKQKLQGG